ncbi:unnamed protein product [Paramecium sonneborni]|uniref:Uncharacterized protein n=1 Tax=Paramecium sonneborni TaxID=65129 RepID=A0A8S1LB47_9CILI|nr:unnamed protein product [Paramecium sonneborni]
MKHLNNQIKNQQQVGIRFISPRKNQKSFLNDSYQILTQKTNLSINQSFSSPKNISNQNSFIITQPINTIINMRDAQQSFKCSSPSMRIKTEKDDQKQEQFMEATLKLLAQNEKLEQLICQQNEMLSIYREDKNQLELTIKRLTQENQFLKESNQKQGLLLEKQLKQVNGKSYYDPKKMLK